MSTNDITGDKLQSKTTTDAYRDGWEVIFGKKDKPVEPVDPCPETTCDEDQNIPCNK